MRPITVLLTPVALLLLGTTPPKPPRTTSKVGEAYAITLTRDAAEQSSDGNSQSSSHDQDSIVERVLAVSADGVELEYDLPKTVTVAERKTQWQFPVRLVRSPNGQLHLLDAQELEARVDRWLKRAKWPRAICGHWIFTWNGFRIECDPQSVIKTIEAFDLRSADLRAGAEYRDAEALEPGRLAQKASGNGSLFSVVLQVSPDAVRRAQAETDVAVGEIMNKPVTLDAAVRKHANDDVAGTISITFETDRSGAAVRRTKVTRLLTKEADGRSKTKTVTEILERRPLPVR